MMEITVTHEQALVPVTIMHLNGDFDADSASNFEKLAGQLIHAGASYLLIDLTEVPFMSSAGIRALNGIYALLHPAKSEDEGKAVRKGIREGTYKAPYLKLLKPNKDVLQVLKMVGIDMYVDTFENQKDALNAFTDG